MPLPIVLAGAAAGAALLGAKKGADAHKTNKKAKENNKRAKRIFKHAKRKLKNQRKETKKTLEELGKEKLRCFDDDIGRFVSNFERLKNVRQEGGVWQDELVDAQITKSQLEDMRKLSVQAGEVVAGGLASVSSGALAGVAAYGGAMMFASASTGTAITALSGAAATNATLAWFGGGSLAAGGAGMAGGTLVLGGIVAGPVIAVGGLMLSSKAKKNLAEAKKRVAKAKRERAQMNNARSIVKGIDEVATSFHEVISKLRGPFQNAVSQLEGVIRRSGVDYSRYSRPEREKVHRAASFAQVVQKVLETPILTEDGALTNEHPQALKAGRKFLAEHAQA